MSSWGASAHPLRSLDEEQEWQATRQTMTSPTTQVMVDRDDERDKVLRHVGRRVGESQWELFVVIDPAEALRQQFEVLQPEFIALHDIGTQSSRRLLAGLAVASGQPVHQLHIRRQGLGMPLARLEFVELQIGEGEPPLRLYTTEVDADTQQRHRLANLLLARSRLGVVIVGDLPPHALSTALLPLHDAIMSSQWSNRQLLMLPLAGAAALASQAAHLAVGTAVQVSTTPLVTRPAEAWSYLRGNWNKLRAKLSESAIHLPEIHDPAIVAPANSGANAQKNAGLPLPLPMPLPMQPMPAPRSTPTPTVRADPALATYIRKCGELKGMVSCCVFELATQRTVGNTGTRPGPAALASQGATLMASMAEAAAAMSLGDAAPDAAITLGGHHQLLRAVPGRPGLAMHAVLDRSVANLTLVRLQLQRLDVLLGDGDAA